MGDLSPMDLFFCGQQPRTCSSSWTLNLALQELTARKLLLNQCLK